MRAREAKEWEKEEEGSRWEWVGAMHVRCKGAAPAMGGGCPGPCPSSHTDQELT